VKTVAVIRERLSWDEMIERVNHLNKKLQRKPKELKAAHSWDPGSILNAYREGNLTFKQAVRELKRWKRL
jgi:hypothetical protein